MSGGAGQTSVVINKGGAQGPSIDLGRYDDGATLRGTVSGQPFQTARSRATRPRGNGGQGRSPWRSEETGDSLKMNGLVAGQLSNWSATKERHRGEDRPVRLPAGARGRGLPGHEHLRRRSGDDPVPLQHPRVEADQHRASSWRSLMSTP